MDQIRISEMLLPWSRLMESSKSELLELYNEQKQKGVMVLFENQEGVWLLDKNADVVLIERK